MIDMVLATDASILYFTILKELRSRITAIQPPSEQHKTITPSNSKKMISFIIETPHPSAFPENFDYHVSHAMTYSPSLPNMQVDNQLPSP